MHIENDRSLNMMLKYTAQTPYCFIDAFPVLRIPFGLRMQIDEVLKCNRPPGMM